MRSSTFYCCCSISENHYLLQGVVIEKIQNIDTWKRAFLTLYWPKCVWKSGHLLKISNVQLKIGINFSKNWKNFLWIFNLKTLYFSIYRKTKSTKVKWKLWNERPQWTIYSWFKNLADKTNQYSVPSIWFRRSIIWRKSQNQKENVCQIPNISV